jgi:hypothetical protein
MIGVVIGFALLLIGIIIVIVGVVMSKKDDKCQDVKCANGTLQEDCSCTCNSGYTGPTCETSSNQGTPGNIEPGGPGGNTGKGGVGGTGNVAVADSAARKKAFYKKAYDADPDDFKIVASWYILYYPCNPPTSNKCPEDKMKTWDPDFDYSTCSFGGCVDTVYADIATSLYNKHKDGTYSRAEFVEFISLMANGKIAVDHGQPAAPMSDFFETYYNYVVPNYPTLLMSASQADQINKGFEVVDKLDWSQTTPSGGGPGEQIYDVGLNPFVQSSWAEVMNRKSGETNESWALRIMLAYYGREPDIHDATPSRGCGSQNAICMAMNGKNTIDAEIWYQLEKELKAACGQNKSMLATAGLYDCDKMGPINMPTISGTVQMSPIPDMWKDVAYVRDHGYNTTKWFNAILYKLTGTVPNGMPVEVENTFYGGSGLNNIWVAKVDAMNGTLTRGFLDELVKTLSQLYGTKNLTSCTASHCPTKYSIELGVDDSAKYCDINCGGFTRPSCYISSWNGCSGNYCNTDYSIRCNWNAQWQRIQQYRNSDGTAKWN